MKKVSLFFLLLLFSCRKGAESPSPSNSLTTASSQSTLKDTSFIHVAINQVPMVVTSINYNRGSSTVHLMAANGLQKVELDTYHLWGTSGFNYQYQDSITFGSRKDALSQWEVVRAPYTTSGVTYNCCSLPTKDSPVNGTFKADFGLESNLFIEGSFHIHFK